MIYVRIDGSTRKAESKVAVFRDRFKNLFPKLKLVTVSAERAYKGAAR